MIVMSRWCRFMRYRSKRLLSLRLQLHEHVLPTCSFTRLLACARMHARLYSMHACKHARIHSCMYLCMLASVHAYASAYPTTRTCNAVANQAASFRACPPCSHASSAHGNKPTQLGSHHSQRLAHASCIRTNARGSLRLAATLLISSVRLSVPSQ
jgi:hypothetical protein